MKVRRALAVAMMLPVGALQVRSQDGAGDWPMYNRDLAGTRYSPLTQITPSNVSRLTRAWSFTIGRDQAAGTLGGGSEFTPMLSTVRCMWRHRTRSSRSSRRTGP